LKKKKAEQLISLRRDRESIDSGKSNLKFVLFCSRECWLGSDVCWVGFADVAGCALAARVVRGGARRFDLHRGLLLCTVSYAPPHSTKHKYKGRRRNISISEPIATSTREKKRKKKKKKKKIFFSHLQI
jgi:hypothetical protein